MSIVLLGGRGEEKSQSESHSVEISIIFIHKHTHTKYFIYKIVHIYFYGILNSVRNNWQYLTERIL